MKKTIIANWKMNPSSIKKAKMLFNSVKKGIKNIKNNEIIVCPPFVYLSELKIKNKESKIKLGAQSCFWEKEGAFTGEISPAMLKDLGIKYVIIGHSERRKYFQETDETINKKLKAGLKMGLKLILCIGETEKERKMGKTFEVLENQLKKDFKDIQYSKPFISNSFGLAYEPVWAIGTGNACLPDMAKEILLFLKKKLKHIPIFYGGSVNSQNARDYIKAGFDGILIGGASLNSQEFIKIIKKINT